jgi:beta-xylosidase
MPQQPIIPGFHPDPSVCRVGDQYYLACSSFEYFPGVPIFRSTDLTSWELIGNVLDRASQLDVTKSPPSGGIFAPTLRHHDGTFWLITTNFSDGGGQVLVHAQAAEGPWSEPVRMPQVKGIDPDLAWDDKGTCYLTYAGFHPTLGVPGIMQAILDPQTGTLLSEPQLIWFGTGGKFPEGPHLYQIAGTWFLLIAEGGTEKGHTAVIGRGPTPAGPFLANPANPILTARSTDRAVQSTGHADLVQRPDDSWVIVFHGVRPAGDSPQWTPLGRETYARDVIWVDGWPVLTTDIEPATTTGSWTDDFTAGALRPEWVAPGGLETGLVDLTGRPGSLGLTAGASSEGSVSARLLGRRQEHPWCSVRAELDASAGVGGISIWIDPTHRYDLELSGRRLRAIARIGPVEQVLGEVTLPDGDPVTLTIDVDRTGVGPTLGSGPDHVTLGYDTGSGPVALTTLDGRYLSTEVAGGMTGRLIGCFVSSGRIQVQRFRYSGAEKTPPG